MVPDDPNVVVAAADGVIAGIEEIEEPEVVKATMKRVAIFLSVMDVHVNRAPVAGTVTRIAYRHGKFLSANLDKASVDNERNALAIRLDDGSDLAVVQIAGLVARRILCDVHEGERVTAGGRFGIIRFGSRTDVYLPHGVMPIVSVGQTMIGGETVIAELPAGAQA